MAGRKRRGCSSWRQTVSYESRSHVFHLRPISSRRLVELITYRIADPLFLSSPPICTRTSGNLASYALPSAYPQQRLSPSGGASSPAFLTFSGVSQHLMTHPFSQLQLLVTVISSPQSGQYTTSPTSKDTISTLPSDCARSSALTYHKPALCADHQLSGIGSARGVIHLGYLKHNHAFEVLVRLFLVQVAVGQVIGRA